MFYGANVKKCSLPISISQAIRHKKTVKKTSNKKKMFRF